MSSCPINPFGLTALWRAAAGLAGGSAVYSIYSKWPLQAVAEGEWLPTVRFGHPRSRANCGNLVPAVLTGSEYYGPSEALTWPRGSTATGHSATERAKAFLQELLQKRRKVPVEVRRLHIGNVPNRTIHSTAAAYKYCGWRCAAAAIGKPTERWLQRIGSIRRTAKRVQSCGRADQHIHIDLNACSPTSAPNRAQPMQCQAADETSNGC